MATDSDFGEASWLLRQLRADRVPLEQVTTMIAERPGDTDEALRARRSLEGMLGVSGDTRIDGAVYQTVAETLAAEDRLEAAEALRALANTDRDLAEADERWRARYSGRPVTVADLRASELIRSGKVQHSPPWFPGVDGAMYGYADHFPHPGAEAVPAVVIATSVPSFEVVTGFESQAARAEWVADRSPTGSGTPLSSCVAGPDCRAVREERVLAWILRRGLGEPEPWPELPGNMFTTDSRSEILLAWRDLAAHTVRRDDWLVEAALAARLLRAPEWAAPGIGPDGSMASLYLYRLVQTPVTRSQAESAVRWLAGQDGVTLSGPAGRSSARTRVAVPPPRAVTGSSLTDMEPPGPGPGAPAGPVAGR